MSTGSASSIVEDTVNRRRADLVALSHDIHAEPELAFDEHRSCAKTQALVAERGFAIQAAPAGSTPRFVPSTAAAPW
jgi:metal-dependent amidase/aminoacylase/carboxypeptidase family protein